MSLTETPLAPLLQVQDLTVEFPVLSRLLRRQIGAVRVVDGISFEIDHGTTLGLVGESGSGKTTVARAVVRTLTPTRGVVNFEGTDLLRLGNRGIRAQRRNIQMVFQDPYSSLNARRSIRQIIEEPLHLYGIGTRKSRKSSVESLLTTVGLDPEIAARYPHELSGGQQQRVAIARAIAVKPRLIVCDEATSSLDVSIQAQVINLLAGLQREMGIGYLFIAHDLAVVRQFADRIAVMYLGQIVESGPSEDIYRTPTHPYTVSLLSSAPIPDPDIERKRIRKVLKGDSPSPASVLTGCRFSGRCWLRTDLGEPEICVTTEPGLQTVQSGDTVDHLAACHFSDVASSILSSPRVEDVAEHGLAPPSEAGRTSTGFESTTKGEHSQ